MNKKIRSILVIFVIILTICILISNSRHVWKLFGYIPCEDPNNVEIHGMFKNYNTNIINVKGISKSKSKHYSGYVANKQGDKLYIGLKFNVLWGYDVNDNNFDIDIPCDINEIKTIYLTDGINEIKIWPMEG